MPRIGLAQAMSGALLLLVLSACGDSEDVARRVTGLEIRSSAGRSIVSWRVEPPGAATVLEVFAADGTLVWREDVAASRALDGVALPILDPHATARLRILDRAGRSLEVRDHRIPPSIPEGLLQELCIQARGLGDGVFIRRWHDRFVRAGTDASDAELEELAAGMAGEIHRMPLWALYEQCRDELGRELAHLPSGSARRERLRDLTMLGHVDAVLLDHGQEPIFEGEARLEPFVRHARGPFPAGGAPGRVLLERSLEASTLGPFMISEVDSPALQIFRDDLIGGWVESQSQRGLRFEAPVVRLDARLEVPADGSLSLAARVLRLRMDRFLSLRVRSAAGGSPLELALRDPAYTHRLSFPDYEGAEAFLALSRLIEVHVAAGTVPPGPAEVEIRVEHVPGVSDVWGCHLLGLYQRGPGR